MREDRCQFEKCDNQSVLIYYGKGICEAHWRQHCEGKVSLKTVFRIKPDKVPVPKT